MPMLGNWEGWGICLLACSSVVLSEVPRTNALSEAASPSVETRSAQNYPQEDADPLEPMETMDTASPDIVSDSDEARPMDIDLRYWPRWKRATGDWMGVRPFLEDHGFTLEASYEADYFYNLRGGLNTSNAGAYTGLFILALTVDTAKADLWEGGTFFLNFQEIHGRDISARHVGDLQGLNSNASDPRTQLAEYWYQHSLFEDRLRFKLGKMDANADFGVVEYALEFINSSAGLKPIMPIPQYPDPAMGAAVLVEPFDWVYAAAGVFDANAKGSRTGFDTAFHGPNHSVTLFETGLRPSFTLGQQVLPGTYRVGGWYHSGEWEVIPRSRFDWRSRTRRGNAGLYGSADQLVYRENPDVEDDTQGLGVFLKFGWAPSAYNEISQFYGFGGQYTGLIPTRDADVTGLGVFHAHLSGRIQSLESRHSETAIELFHKVQLTPFFSIKPDVQYIVNPGGDGRDAIVAGVRLEMIF